MSSNDNNIFTINWNNLFLNHNNSNLNNFKMTITNDNSYDNIKIPNHEKFESKHILTILAFFLACFLGMLVILFTCRFFFKFIRRKLMKKNNSAPVVVTSSTHVPPNAGVNYPVDEPVRGYQTAHTPYSQPSYPMPQPAPVHTGVPYPINNTGMPMPQTNTPYPPAQPVGYQAPYPPAQNPQDVLPPSYDQVVGTTGPASAPYNKQAPYNPHYTGN
ncbi:uncharacterized protein LOC129611234 isoform X4 [Condylostylus longicornis]|uniref:uncharacterized protein LOC129611234 isoform X4 n=1 Tax=Condylostylus longicornis TaxID=2530218 RepID=UPI00244E30A8|nr:uncharacterized protein LOC129611234 isoform X4 [Condylostylus longicornis]